MSEINLTFTNQDWQRIERDYTAWWAGELERPLIYMMGHAEGSEAVRRDAPHMPGHLPLDLPVEECVNRYTRKLECTRWYGDGFPFWWLDFGPGVLTAFAGLSKMNASIEYGTIWFDPLEIRELDDLRIAYDGNNPLWRHVKELAAAAIRRWGKQVCVGYPDFGGNLDLLAVLRTTDTLLLDTMDEPGKLGQACQQMTRLWLRYFKEFHELTGGGRGYSSWGPTWAPGSTFMLQSDFAYMIAPHMFDEFVIPDLEACCEAIDYPFYHLDGKGQLAHLDLLCAMKNLRGIQWVPGAGVPPAVDWPEVIQKITDSGKLCQIYATPEEAVRYLKDHDGKGLQIWVTDPQPEAVAREMLDTIRLR